MVVLDDDGFGMVLDDDKNGGFGWFWMMIKWWFWMVLDDTLR